jgi:hypothetical protein
MSLVMRSKLERAAAKLSADIGEPVTISDVLRGAATAIANGRFDGAAMHFGLRAISAKPQTEADRAALCTFLGLPDDATDEEITAAVEGMLGSAAPPAPAGATGGSADVPPERAALLAQLTAPERRAAAKMNAAELGRFVALRAARRRAK